MNWQVVFTLGVCYFNHFVAIIQFAGIANLSTHFSVEWSLFQHNLIELSIFLLYFAVAQNLCSNRIFVISYELRIAFVYSYPVGSFNGSGVAGTLFLFCHFRIKLFFIHIKAVFLEDKFCQIKRESVGVIQDECFISADCCLSCLLCVVNHFLKTFDTCFKGTQERFFLFLNYFLNQVSLCSQFRISFTHWLNQSVDQTIKERLFLSQESIGITYGTTKNTTDYITGFCVRRKLGIGNWERNRTNVVGNNAHGDIGLLVVSISFARQLADFLQHWLEYVRVIVWSLALQSDTKTFKAHTGIDNTGRKRFERAVGLMIILHEHKVPDFNYLRMAFVYEFSTVLFSAFRIWTQVDMDFRARTTWTGFSHFPEIVLTVSVQNMVFWQMLFPIFCSFVVTAQSFRSVTFEDCSIKTVRIDFQHIHQVFPCPVNGFFFEVVAEWPVAEHFKHCMVICVQTYFFQVVVLTAHA